MICFRKINKIPEFYTIFGRKMPEFYIIIARKIFFPNLGGHVPPLPPVSYGYAKVVHFVEHSELANKLLPFLTPAGILY